MVSPFPDYMIHPGSNKLWAKDEHVGNVVPNCCFQPVWREDSNGKDRATCLLKGMLNIKVNQVKIIYITIKLIRFPVPSQLCTAFLFH